MLRRIPKMLAATSLAVTLPVSATYAVPIAAAAPAKPTIVPLHNDIAERLESKTIFAIQNQEIKIHSRENLAYAKTVANKATKKGITNYSVTVPLISQYTLTSSVTVLFSKPENIA